MDSITFAPWQLALLVIITVIGVALVQRLMSRAKPSAIEVSAEETAFQTLETALEMLADKTGEQKIVEAANARMALKDQLLGKAAASLQAKLPPAAP